MGSTADVTLISQRVMENKEVVKIAIFLWGSLSNKFIIKKCEYDGQFKSKSDF